MELFAKAKSIRLRGHHDKYLVAEDDEEGVIQDRSGASRAARWEVEPVEPTGAADPLLPPAIRLKSCYGRYLCASNSAFLLGMTGHKVIQADRSQDDVEESSLEWEPVREGVQVRLRTRHGHFLRANGGPPPWRNSVTHDVPHRTATRDWILWDVDVVEVRMPSRTVSLASYPDDNSQQYSPSSSSAPSPASSSSSSSRYLSAASFSSSPSPSPRAAAAPTPRGLKKLLLAASSYRASHDSQRNQNQGSRTIHYVFATSDDADGIADEPAASSVLEFKGSSVEDLTARLREETGQQHIVVCTRSPLNGKLLPLRLSLPPAHSSVSVVVVPSSSKIAKNFPQSPLSPETP